MTYREILWKTRLLRRAVAKADDLGRFNVMIGFLFFAMILIGCGESSSASKGTATKPKLQFPVEVAIVESRDAEFTVNAVGSVEAFEIVPVTARVSGVVEKVLFTEGDRAEEGAPLIEIEPERFALNLKSAQAQYAKASASLAEAQAGLLRRSDIVEKNPGWVSPEEMQDWQTRVRTLQADSAQAHANFELAKLNQRDSRIPSPARGVIQSRSVRTGQYVQAGTVVATLVRRDPLLLRVSVPEQDASRIKPGLDIEFTTGDRGTTYKAKVIAVTEAADQTTRMISVTAEVTESRRDLLRPGAFAEAVIKLGESKVLPIIPQTAIRPSERGFLAFVVEDSIAQERVLKLGMQTASGMVEVRDGIRAGEQVVIRGAEALRDKAPVRIVRNKPDTEVAADTSKRIPS